MLICQDKKIKDIYYGGRKIQAAYLGNKKVFSRNFWKYAGGFGFVAYLLLDGKLLSCTQESCSVIEENVTDAVFYPRNILVYYIKDNFFYEKNSSRTKVYGNASKIVGAWIGNLPGHEESYSVPISLQRNGQILLR